MHNTTPRATLGRAAAVLAAVLVASLASAGQFPVPATFTAVLGASAVAGGVGGPGGGAVGTGATSLGSGTPVSVAIMSYSSQEELQRLSQVTDPATFIKTLASFSHGSVRLGNRTFEINAASSRQVGSKYSVSVLTAKPLEASAGPASAGGTAGGVIHLTVDASGKGIGSMYTAAHVAVSVDGVFTVHAGTATATELKNVAKQ